MTTREADTRTLCLPLPSDGLVGDSDAAAGPGLLSEGARRSGEAPANIMHAAAEKSIFPKRDSTARGMTRCCLGCFSEEPWSLFGSQQLFYMRSHVAQKATALAESR